MNDGNWDILAELFQQALDLPADKRRRFVEEACEGNEPLRLELESLLNNFDEAPAFFGSLGDVVPPLPAEEHDTVDPYQFIGRQIENYKITELLGAGGMGIVYKAEDIDLGRPVALKFLPPTLSNNAKARERFITEARAASQLDHPNICSIYQIGRTEEGWIFIAMAFYDGITLKQILEKGNIPSNLALDYALQITRGLAKAHQNKIVHRDIKPANLMVTRDDTVKILDFGLAKIADQQLTQTGQTMGTVSYMSPEQARGEKNDHRTDIWSLGVLMYEMMSGQRPFKGNNAQATIFNLLNEEPVPLATANPQISGQTAAIVHRCLQKELSLRYQATDEILRDLEHLSEEKVRATQPVTTKRNYTPVLLGALVLLVALLTPTLVQKWTNSDARIPLASKEIKVALLPFTGVPEDNPETQALATGFMVLIEDLLNRLDPPDGSLWVVPINETQDLEVINATMASDLLGANLAMQGDLQKLDNVVALSLELIDAQEARLLETETRLLDAATIKDKIGNGFHDQLVEALSSLLGFELTESALRTIENAVPDDPDAYAFYLQGIGYLERLDKENYIDYAIQQFDQSIAADSLFAMSHAGLCEAKWEKYRRSNDENTADEAIASCNKAATLSEDQPEVLTHIGSILFQTGQFDLAEAALRKAISLKTDYDQAYRWLARIYERRGIPDSVVTFYQQAITLKPNNWIYYNELGIYQHTNGAMAASAIQFERVQQLTPDNHLASNALGITRQFLNEVDEAERLFRLAIDQNDESVEPRRNLGQLLFRQGQYAAAATELEPAAQRGDFISQSYRGHALYWAGDVDGANEAWDEVINITTARVALEPTNFVAQTLLADALIATQQFTVGQEAINQLQEIAGDHIYVSYYLGRMYEQLGNRANALSFIERAFSRNFDFYLIDNDPWLSSLREDPRYTALSAQYEPTN